MFGFFTKDFGRHSGGQSLYLHCKKRKLHPFDLYLGWQKGIACPRCAEAKVCAKPEPRLGKEKSSGLQRAPNKWVTRPKSSSRKTKGVGSGCNRFATPFVSPGRRSPADGPAPCSTWHCGRVANRGSNQINELTPLSARISEYWACQTQSTSIQQQGELNFLSVPPFHHSQPDPSQSSGLSCLGQEARHGDGPPPLSLKRRWRDYLSR